MSATFIMCLVYIMILVLFMMHLFFTKTFRIMIFDLMTKYICDDGLYWADTSE